MRECTTGEGRDGDAPPVVNRSCKCVVGVSQLAPPWITRASLRGSAGWWAAGSSRKLELGCLSAAVQEVLSRACFQTCLLDVDTDSKQTQRCTFSLAAPGLGWACQDARPDPWLLHWGFSRQLQIAALLTQGSS